MIRHDVIGAPPPDRGACSRTGSSTRGVVSSGRSTRAGAPRTQALARTLSSCCRGHARLGPRCERTARRLTSPGTADAHQVGAAVRTTRRLPMQARDAGGVGCGWHATVSVNGRRMPGRAARARRPPCRRVGEVLRESRVSPVRGRVRRACLAVRYNCQATAAAYTTTTPLLAANVRQT